MGYTNFKPTIWAAGIEKELERLSIFALDCNRQYEGDVSKMGDQVRILGVGKPTITTTTDKSITLTGAESVEDTSVTLVINKVSYFDYKVDDIDKREAQKGIMEALRAETSEALAATVDDEIADLASTADAIKLHASGSETVITATNILGEMANAMAALHKNNVSPQTEIVFDLSVDAAKLFTQAYVALDTNNSNYLKNGYLGKWNGATVRVSNNVYNSSSIEYIMVRTKRAVAFVQPMTHIEPYRPEKGFSDAVKGFILYGAKIVRPKELIIMNVKYS